MRWSVLVAVALAIGLVGFAPPAAARVVCETEPQAFNSLDGTSSHTFGCPFFFNAYLVIANNAETNLPFPLPPGGAPAHFTACMVAPDGTEQRCEEGCGHLLVQKAPSGVQVRVHLSMGSSPECLTLTGHVRTVFADE